MAFSRVAAPCRARTVVPCCSSRVAVVTGPKPSIGKLASSRAAHAHVRDTICTAASGAVGTAAQDEPVGASYWQGVFSVLNILMGVGLLSIPLALAKSGWAGLLVLWLLGIVTNYTGKALVRCYNTVEKTTGAEQVKYEDIAGTAFGAWGKRIISVIMYTELVGICALLLILQGDNLWNLFGTALASSPTHCMMIATLFIVPTVWAPDVKSLSVLGMAGFTATFTVCAVLAYTLLTGDFTPGASTAVVDWSNLPLIFGIMAFVYAGHSVFPAIQTSMQQPQLFPSVLNTAYILVGSLCTFLGISGYYMYGNGALDVITFNLKSGLAKTVCACLVLVNPLAKFALTMEPVAIGVREKLAKTLRVDTSYLFRVMVNTLLVGCILLIARFLPYLALVMSLIGSFMTITISVIFPAAANYKLHSADMSTAEKLWCFAVVAIGIACAISGTTSAILALQAKM